jgi:hypothetical protein
MQRGEREERERKRERESSRRKAKLKPLGAQGVGAGGLREGSLHWKPIVRHFRFFLFFSFKRGKSHQIPLSSVCLSHPPRQHFWPKDVP